MSSHVAPGASPVPPPAPPPAPRDLPDSTAKRRLRRVSKVLLDVVFRSVEVPRVQPVPDGPTLVLANHGGGLADILVLIDVCQRFPRFLARDLIWRVPLGASVMNAVGGIPVHRRADHGGTADNVGMFDSAFAGLAQGSLLAIYPEGESVPEPRLAPLRTGAARIALGALARGVDTTIVPMGLHYFDISVLRGRCFVDIGPAFSTSSVVAELGDCGEVSENNHQLVKAMTQVLAERLGDVVDEYDGWDQRRLYEAAASVFLQAHQGDPHEPLDYEAMAELAHAITQAPVEQQIDVANSMQGLRAELEILGVGLDMLPRVSMKGTKIAAQTGLTLALLGPAAYGAMLNAVPMGLIRAASMSGMAPATAATVKPAIAVVTFPAVWALAGLWGYRRFGVAGAVGMAASGPASLIATVRVAERAQLMFYLGRARRRAHRRASGALLDAKHAVIASVARIADPGLQRSGAETPATT